MAYETPTAILQLNRRRFEAMGYLLAWNDKHVALIHPSGQLTSWERTSPTLEASLDDKYDWAKRGAALPLNA